MLNVEKKKGKKSPHLAITHQEYQGGAANGRNVSLLMKSDVQITPEIASLIEKVTGIPVDPSKVVDIEKMSYQRLMDKLGEAIKKFDSKEEYQWSWVQDFDDEYVVFSNNSGLFYTTYSVDTNGEVTVGDEATSVNRVVFYESSDNSLILSNEPSDNGSVQSLIVKNMDKINGDDKLKTVLKSLKEKEQGKMQEEVQKAVKDATEALQVELEKATSDLKAAQEKIESMEKAAKEAIAKERQEKISAVIADKEKAEELFKATEEVSDEAFATILKSFQATAEMIEKSDLFKKESTASSVEAQDEEPLHVKMLKDKYEQK